MKEIKIKGEDCINAINEKHRRFAKSLYHITTEDYPIKGELMLCFCSKQIHKVDGLLQLTNDDNTITKK